MAFIEFITTQYIKERSIVESNVDDKLLQYYIRKAQDLHTQIILGQDLYESLMNQAASGTFNSTFYQTLLNNYVQPALLEWTIYESIPFINWKITNKAIVQQTSDHATGVTTGDLKWLKSLQMNDSGFYDQRVREYIINNPGEFLEYYQLNGVERIAPATLTGFNMIYTSKYGRGSRGRRGNSFWGEGGCCSGPNGGPISL
jgi:hypothetical protein